MVTASAPLRISFAGGGTDMHPPGRCLAAAINRRVYVRVEHQVPDRELTPRELCCLKLLDIKEPVDVRHFCSMHRQSGLGGSSSYTVALLCALHALKSEHCTPLQLASEACLVERVMLKELTGVQDQYMAAFGGFKLLEIGLQVEVRDVFQLLPLDPWLHLFCTGVLRPASRILQTYTFDPAFCEEMRMLVLDMVNMLGNGCSKDFCKSIQRAWWLKKQFSSEVSPVWMDALVQKAMDAGALGVKLCGAGGGGYFLAAIEPHKAEQLIAAFPLLEHAYVQLGGPGACVEQPSSIATGL